MPGILAVAVPAFFRGTMMKLGYVAWFLLSIGTPTLAANLSAQAPGSSVANTKTVLGKELWLFGGGEPICSSVEPQFCEPATIEAAKQHFVATGAFREKTFLLSAVAISHLQDLSGWPADINRKALVIARLQQLLAIAPAQPRPESQWLAALETLELSDDEQNLLDDWFEQRPKLADGSTAAMQVYYPGVAPYVRHMFEAFVASAKNRSRGKGKPRLVLITASSNDPLQWVDYYLQLFRGAGADAMWLPLEPSLTQQPNCDEINQQRFIHNGQYNRNARYPELAAYQLQLCRAPEQMQAMLQNADAVFINGGDQSLTMRSLQLPSGEFSELGKLLQQKIAAGMPLAGSSAGTAVQSGRMNSGDQAAIPMLSGGSTRKALQFGAFADVPDAPLCLLHHRCTAKAPSGYLTYKPDGGLRSFSLGVVDTHFREREREGRLTRLLLDTHTDFGFGVDEATVLRANFFADDGADLQVMGHGGVWMLDASKAQVSAVNQSSKATEAKQGEATEPLPSALLWQATGLRASRLLAGDQLRWQQGPQQAKLNCQQQLQGLQVDPVTYAAVDQRRWQAGDGLITACERADGRWRYLQLPLTLTVLQESDAQQ